MFKRKCPVASPAVPLYSIQSSALLSPTRALAMLRFCSLVSALLLLFSPAGAADPPGAWKYRDWVIRALNADRPYDRLVLEQLAGDEVPDADTESVLATGFLRLGPWDDEPADPKTDRYDQLDDLVAVTSEAF